MIIIIIKRDNNTESSARCDMWHQLGLDKLQL